MNLPQFQMPQFPQLPQLPELSQLNIVNIVSVLVIAGVLLYVYMRLSTLSQQASAIDTRVTDLDKTVGERIATLDNTVGQRISSLDNNVANVNKSLSQSIQSVSNNLGKDIQDVNNNLKTNISGVEKTFQDSVRRLDDTDINILKATESSLAKANLTNGGKIQGDIDVATVVKSAKYKIGDKWTLSGVGDAQGNDEWLRFFNKDANGYYGGLAAGKLYSDNSIQSKTGNIDTTLNVGGDFNTGGNIIMSGNNRWIIHTPKDGRKTMYIAAAGANGDWDFSKQVRIEPDSSMYVDNVTANKKLCIGSTCVDEAKLKKL